MTRALGSITDALLGAAVVDYEPFIKWEFPSPTNTKRFTTRSGGFTGDIDGSSQTWDEFGFRIGALQQSMDGVLPVSWVEFDNLDYTWTNLAYTPGLRGVVVSIYFGWFDSSGALVDAYLGYSGKADEHDLSDKCRVSLIPHAPIWTNRILGPDIGESCINTYKDPDTCQYAGAEPGGETTCHKSRKNCDDRSNILNFNGDDLMPSPNTPFQWGVYQSGGARPSARPRPPRAPAPPPPVPPPPPPSQPPSGGSGFPGGGSPGGGGLPPPP